MNRIYRLVWNATQRTWVVAGELTRARKKTKVLCAALVLSTGVGSFAVADTTSVGSDGYPYDAVSNTGTTGIDGTPAYQFTTSPTTVANDNVVNVDPDEIITGGNGSDGSSDVNDEGISGNGGVGGNAVNAGSITLNNNGSILGGSGGAGGDGYDGNVILGIGGKGGNAINGDNLIINNALSGHITGGNGGNGGAAFNNGSTSAGGNIGGSALNVNNSTINNSGSLLGGIGGEGGGAFGGNTIVASAGQGGGAVSGDELIVTNTSDGVISGGKGGKGGDVLGSPTRGGMGGRGGLGVAANNSTINNNGIIYGGDGGSGGNGGVDIFDFGFTGPGDGGIGGNGNSAIKGNGLIIVNTGSLNGGMGGSGGNGSSTHTSNGGNGGNGGDTISGTDLTITNSGSIVRGSGSSGGTSNGGATGTSGVGGAAIRFDNGENTLTLNDGSSITGDLVLSATTTDTTNSLSLNSNAATIIDGNLIANEYTDVKLSGRPLTLTGSANFAGNNTLTFSNAAQGLALQADSIVFNNTQLEAASGLTNWIRSNYTLATTTNGISGSFDTVNNLLTSGAKDYASIYTSSNGNDLLYGLKWNDESGDGYGTYDLKEGATLTLALGLTDNTSINTNNWDGSSLTKAGKGTLVLAGNNTYTGGTVIDSGILQLGNGGTSGSVGGDITNNGTLAFNRSDEHIFAGTISGSGTVNQAGTGSTILTSDNTYTGGTTISAGTLQLGNGGTSGSVTGDITNNGTLAFNRSDDHIFAGTISGSGAVNQVGTGSTILTSDNTYTGGTTISAGTLQLGNGGTSGSVTGDITNNGTLAFNRSDDHIFAGTISGSGAVNQVGTGSTILTSDNTYTGGTVIDSGTLQLGNGGVTGSVAGDITNNGALVFNRSNAMAYDGVISGSGDVVQAGSGTTTLTGNNTYTGTTHIDNGVLKTAVSDAFANTSGVTIAENGVLNLGATSQTVNTLNNSGTLLFNDYGAQAVAQAVVLTGNVTNSGLVVINNGSYNAGQTLTVDGNWVGNGGTVSIGTVLGGDDSLTDKLAITGSASGTTYVAVSNEGGSGAQTLEGINVVSTGSSTRDAFVQKGRIVAGSYEYHLQQGTTSGANTNNWYLTSQSESGNNGGSGENGNNGNNGNNSQQTYRPERGSYAANLAAAATMFTTRLNDRQSGGVYVDPLTGERYPTSLWMRAVGGHNEGKMSDGQSSFTANRMVYQLGGDVLSGALGNEDALHIGVMAGYGKQSSKTRNSVSGYASRGTVEGYSTGLYGTWYQNDKDKTGLYVDSWMLYSWFNNRVKGDELAYEKYKSKGLTASIESGYIFHAGSYLTDSGMENNVYIRPQAQVLWLGVKANDHTEQNGTRIEGKGNDNVQTRLGVRLSMTGQSRLDKGSVRKFEPFIEANWVYTAKEYGVKMGDASSYIRGSRNVAEVKTGVEGQVSEHLSVWGNVGQQFGNSGYRDTQGMLGVKYAF